MTASVANCFILTFRAVSRAAKLEWLRLECQVEAALEKVQTIAQLSRFEADATPTVLQGADAVKVKQPLDRAYRGCRVANSLRETRTPEADIVTSSDGQ